jgi:predicted Zn-dependent protease with MMP-like domain
MKPDTYRLLERCIEDGLSRGYHRAHKHNDDPTEEQLKDAMANAIMHEIAEWFRFDEITQ